MIVAFILAVTLAPTVAPERVETIRSGGSASSGVGGDGTSTGVTVPGGVASGGGSGTGKTSACGDRALQIPGDSYSPPCVAFTGDNGGSTYLGVSKDKIRVGFRIPVEDVRDLQGVINELTAGSDRDFPEPTDADVSRTLDGIIQYFNRNFQFYGRKIELIEWKGQGSALNEILGAGQEAANADAIKASNEIKVFGDLSAFTAPYNDALARRKIVAIGAPYMSNEWFAARAPYSWSIFPDCTQIAETIAEWGVKRVLPYPVSRAGKDLNGKKRKVGIVAPDNPEYQQCVDAAERKVKAAGYEINRYSYTLDLSTASDQANNLAARLRSDGITTVVLASDPLVPLLLVSRMSQQSYFPEWVVTGTALTDIDLVGQIYDTEQWKNAFGISYYAEQQPAGSSYAYFAFKSIYPDAEPIIGVELLYYYFYMFALGVQMAGPNLTPQTFAAGLRAYPGGSGPAGTWGFPAGTYTPYRDAREIYWDPLDLSVYNGKAGRYASNGKRYRIGEWPKGEAPSK